ncbi:MAG: Translation initiation factor [Cyanobacteriota bacterium]|jgi:hypothetical protein
MVRFRHQRRRPSPLPLVLLLAVASGGLSACRGTRFGDQLAGSFSTPPAASTQSTGPTPSLSPSAGTTNAASPRSARPTAAAPPASTAATTPQARPVSPAQSPPLPAAPPAPYRVTIRLPAADPAAPAERVTEVLRAAGVPFEVETIERITAGAGATAPVTPLRTPAPAPR